MKVAAAITAEKAQRVLAICPQCHRSGPKARLREHLMVDHGKDAT